MTALLLLNGALARAADVNVAVAANFIATAALLAYLKSEAVRKVIRAHGYEF